MRFCAKVELPIRRTDILAMPAIVFIVVSSFMFVGFIQVYCTDGFFTPYHQINAVSSVLAFVRGCKSATKM